jgi:membrane protein
VAASINAFEYHPPAQALPVGAEFLGLLVVLKHFVAAQRSGEVLDPASVQLLEPYLRSSQVTCYFDDLQRADLIQRSESGGWLLTRSLDSTDLLRVYAGTQYRLPLHPAEQAQTLGIALPPVLLELLDAVAETLHAALGTRLDRVYPPTAAPADAPKES